MPLFMKISRIIYVLIGFSGIPFALLLALFPGGQEPLPLKVAPIQPSVTAAFHLQSWRDSDSQMWELRQASRIMGNSIPHFPEHVIVYSCWD